MFNVRLADRMPIVALPPLLNLLSCLVDFGLLAEQPNRLAVPPKMASLCYIGKSKYRKNKSIWLKRLPKLTFRCQLRPAVLSNLDQHSRRDQLQELVQLAHKKPCNGHFV